jgi:hypothetical protein
MATWSVPERGREVERVGSAFCREKGETRGKGRGACLEVRGEEIDLTEQKDCLWMFGEVNEKRRRGKADEFLVP